MKVVRALTWLVAGATALGASVYFFIYLYVWEFHRALITAVIFLAAEVAIVGALVLRRLRRLPAEQDGQAVDPQVLARLRETAPSSDHFAWLRRRTETPNVFITVLLGGGVLVSAIAWAVERIARRTATPGLEEGLARRLSSIGFPSDGLVASEGELLAQEGPYADDSQLRVLLGPGAAAGDRR